MGKLMRHVNELLGVFRLPQGAAGSSQACAACIGHRLETLVVSREWSALFRHMAELLHRMSEAQKASFKDEIYSRRRAVASPVRRSATWSANAHADGTLDLCVQPNAPPSIISRAMSTAPAANERDQLLGMEDSLEMSTVSDLDASLALASDLDVGSPRLSERETEIDVSMIARSFDEAPATHVAARPIRGKIGSSALLVGLAAVWCSYFAFSTFFVLGEKD